MAEELGDFPPRDPVDQVVGWEILAGAEERAGDYKAAGMDLQRAAARVAAFPEDNGIILRKAEIAVENARIQLDLGDPKALSAALAPLRQEFETADPGAISSELLFNLRRGEPCPRSSQAADPCWNALFHHGGGLIELRSEADRLSWSRTRGEIYRDLLEIRLNSESPAQPWLGGSGTKALPSAKPRQGNTPKPTTQGVHLPLQTRRPIGCRRGRR